MLVKGATGNTQIGSKSTLFSRVTLEFDGWHYKTIGHAIWDKGGQFNDHIHIDLEQKINRHIANISTQSLKFYEIKHMSKYYTNKRPDGQSSSTASINTHWNTPAHTPNNIKKGEDVKPVEIFEKMTKDLNQVLFWDQKWPGNWACEADIQNTSNSCSNWHVNQ